MSDLHVKYRPTTLKAVVGQDEAVKTLKNYLRNGGLPHCLMLVGPSGVGKTTLAHILGGKVGCGGGDFFEINCAAKDGPDQIRDIPDRVRLYPMGESRMWYFDEFQSLSRAGFAQQSLLKVFEDFPAHAYFVLATTDPSKIIETIRTRCKEVSLKPVKPEVIAALVTTIAGEEGKPVSAKVAEGLGDYAEGSPRRALVKLGELLCLDGEEAQLAALAGGELHKTVDELVKLLMWGKGASWVKAAAVLRDLKGEDPEGVRRRILATAASCMLKADANSKRAAEVADCFQFDTFASGFAGLCCAAYRVLGGFK